MRGTPLQLEYSKEHSREEGVIKGWGLGVNCVEPCELALDRTDPDGFLLAGRCTLLDHTSALDRLMPAAAQRGLGIVVCGPYNSGVLAGGSYYEYQKAPAEMLARVEQIKTIYARFEVDIRAVALVFSLAPYAVNRYRHICLTVSAKAARGGNIDTFSSTDTPTLHCPDHHGSHRATTPFS